MKRILNLICNAHLDPVWLWEREEGVAEALSTFRVAADFCDKYDNFVFTHNEALLYEYIEEHDLELFNRIKRLVHQNKWRIIGGWYLQPDCNMLSGESFIRQISIGRKYFKEKFGVEPKVAVNFDSFGHTRGLVQILKKFRYDGYLFMRPQDRDSGSFLWEGFEGSIIKAHKIFGGYGTVKGEALGKVKEYICDADDSETHILTWGIGNHGGGASKQDIEEINEFINAENEWEIKHSFPEAYFDCINENLPIEKNSLTHVFIGCYSSMVRIKQQHRRVENKIKLCEIILTHCEALHQLKYNIEQINEAERALMFCQFHDILPGTCISRGEEASLRMLSHAETILDRLIMKAFFRLCKNQKMCDEGDIPIIVYNPLPYDITTEIEMEYQLQKQNWNENECTVGSVYDIYGNKLPTQNEREDCSVNLDWRKKIVFNAELKAMSINRFNCRQEVKSDYIKVSPCKESADCYIVDGDNIEFHLNKKTGLIEKYIVDGKSVISMPTGYVKMFSDNEDPWGMNVVGFNDGENIYALMSPEQIKNYCAFSNYGLSPVCLIENGEVRSKFQIFMCCERSYAVVEYTVYKKSKYFDVNISLLNNNANRTIKYELNTGMEDAVFCGETAFGTDLLHQEGKEAVFQRWCLSSDGKRAFAVINNGTYAGSYMNGKISLTLCRTTVNSAHPILERELVPHDRFIKHMDMGERNFDFRIYAGEKGEIIDNITIQATLFNIKMIALPVFTYGDYIGEPNSFVKLTNKKIELSCMKNTEKGILFRLFNSVETIQNTEIRFENMNINKKVILNGFEVKTFLISNGVLCEQENWEE